MADETPNPLEAEKTAIEQRITDAKTEPEKTALRRQYGERLAHLKERLKPADTPPAEE